MLDSNFLMTNIFSIGNVDAKKVLESLEEDKINARDDDEQPRKRRRLDDFTPQERMVRRKLKNRVAAQNARDRKKERMDHLESVVSRLDIENKELKRSNEELRCNMHFLIEQNKELREKLGMNDSIGSKNVTDKAQKQPQVSTPVVPDHDHIVIRKEVESEPEHASLRISQLQKLRTLLVSLITIWLTNPRLTTYFISLDNPSLEKALKAMLLKKLESRLSQKCGRKQQSIDAVLRMNLLPIFQTCLLKKKMNYSNSAKISKPWWGNQIIL